MLLRRIEGSNPQHDGGSTFHNYVDNYAILCPMSAENQACRVSDVPAPIPGTYVFDGAAAVMGHNLNRMVSSLAKAENRARFAADEEAYIAAYRLSPEQSSAFRRRDWLELVRMGGNIYYIYKLTAIEHLKMSEVGAMQAGLSHDDFLALLKSRGTT